MRILLIEDDVETATFLEKRLREVGHQAEVCLDGEAGLDRASQGAFDLMIVDRMLPKLDGLSLVRAARAEGIDSAILFLTARGAVNDRVEGLECGADDYLVKPFSFEELNARVNALGRRPRAREDSAELVVGPLSLDRLKRFVTRNGLPVDLQAREFQILETLMLNAGKLVTRKMLLEQIWDFHFDPGSNVVETHISRIRSKIGRPGDEELIRTVRGAGYIIRAE